MLTGIYLADAGGGVDPTRMAAQVISGIGFLGAGTILRFRASVRGLTTAASLWAVGGIGLAVGAGFWLGAVLTALIVMTALLVFSRLERAMRRDWYQILVVETSGAAADLAGIRSLLAEYDIEIRDIDIKAGNAPGRVRLELHVKLLPDQPHEEIVSKLLQLERTVGAYWA